MKRTMLDFAYRQFLTDNYTGTEPSLQATSARGWLLERFIREEGDSLERFALFQVLEEERRLIELAPKLWPEWPEQYRSPGSPALREFVKRHRKRVRFFQYMQWVAADQLRGAKAARRPGQYDRRSVSRSGARQRSQWRRGVDAARCSGVGCGLRCALRMPLPRKVRTGASRRFTRSGSRLRAIALS